MEDRKPPKKTACALKKKGGADGTKQNQVKKKSQS